MAHKQRLTIFKDDDVTPLGDGKYKVVYTNNFEQYQGLTIDGFHEPVIVDPLLSLNTEFNVRYTETGQDRFGFGSKTGRQAGTLFIPGMPVCSGNFRMSATPEEPQYAVFTISGLNPDWMYRFHADVAGYYSLTGFIIPFISLVGVTSGQTVLIGGINGFQTEWENVITPPIAPNLDGTMELRWGVIGYGAYADQCVSAGRAWTIDNIRLEVYSGVDVETQMGPSGVIYPTFTTHEENPYLKWLDEGPSREVDFPNGKSSIGSITCEIIDKRTEPTDQASGIVTSMLAEDGQNDWIGHRAVYEEWDPVNLRWRTVIDGRITDMELSGSNVAYKVTIADEREIERTTRAFVRGYNSTVLPRGVHGGWGSTYKDTIFEKQLIPESAGYYTGIFTKVDSASVFNPASGYVTVVGPSPETIDDDQWEMLTVQPYVDTNQLFSAGRQYAFTRVIGAWQANIADNVYWHYLYNMPGPSVPITFIPNAFDVLSQADFRQGILVDGKTNRKNTSRGTLRLWLYANTDAELPANGDNIRITYLSADPPSEKYPAWIDAITLGQFLKNLYDGVYSEEDTNIRYDADDMEFLVNNTPTMNIKIEKEAENVREFAEEHIYKVLGRAPVLNEAGEITSIPYAMPEAGVTLFELNNDNVKEARWKHTKNNVVNRVNFVYKRYFLRVEEEKGQNIMERLADRDVEFKFTNVDASLLGNSEIDYEPLTITSVVYGNNTGLPESFSEGGTLIALQRAKDVVYRFHRGAPEIEAIALRRATGIDDIVEGDWGSIECTWLPDYDGLTRGGARLVQVLAIQKSENYVTFTLSDAGPVLEPLDPPTLSNYVVNDNNSISVDVDTIPTLPSGNKAYAVLKYAISDTEPSCSSVKWLTFGTVNTEGSTVTSARMPSGATVWVTAVSTAIGYRSSTCVDPVSLNIPAVAQILNAKIVFGDNGELSISWVGNAVTDNVDVCYDIGNLSTSPTYATCANVADAGADGTTYSPGGVVVPGSRTVFAKLTPYNDADEAGDPYYLVLTRMDDDEIVLPTFVKKPSQTATVGTLLVEVTDPQQRLKTFEFATQSGPGAISAYAVDSAVPYQTTVDLVEAFPSKIFFKATYYNIDGEEATYEDSHTFSSQNKPNIPRLSGAVDSLGAPHLIAQGDAITANIKITYSLSGFPSAGDVRATTALPGRSVVLDPAVTMSDTDILYVAAFAYTSGGEESEIGYLMLTAQGATNSGISEGRPADFPLTMRAGAPLILRSIPADLTIHSAEARTDWKYCNLSKVGKMRVQGGSGRAASVGTKIVLVYSLNAGTSWTELGPYMLMDAIKHPSLGDYIDIAEGAKVDNALLGWATKDGDGVSSIEVGNIYVDSVSSPTPPDSEEGDPDSDLPIGGLLGNIIHDLDAIQLAADPIVIVGGGDPNRVLADGEEVFMWPDYSATGANALPIGPIQNPPIFLADGWSTGGPAVQFTEGGGHGLTISSQLTGGDFTTYIVAEGFSSPISGISNFFNAGNGYPKGKGLTIVGLEYVGSPGGIGGYVNTHFAFPTFQNIQATWDMTQKHIYRFVFIRSLGTWMLFVDGVSITTPPEGVDCPPQYTESTVIQIGVSADLDPVTMRWAREITYDQAHTSEGDTVVETALRAIWGF